MPQTSRLRLRVWEAFSDDLAASEIVGSRGNRLADNERWNEGSSPMSLKQLDELSPWHCILHSRRAIVSRQLSSQCISHLYPCPRIVRDTRSQQGLSFAPFWTVLPPAPQARHGARNAPGEVMRKAGELLYVNGWFDDRKMASKAEERGTLRHRYLIGQ